MIERHSASIRRIHTPRPPQVAGSSYRDRLGTDVVPPRIFIYCGVQPWFSAGVWNLDRIYLHGDRLWHMEIKHRYPMDRPDGLKFGINHRVLRQIARLLECGLRSLHVVTVKPHWKRQSGSTYLLTDLKAKSKATTISMWSRPGKPFRRRFAGPAGVGQPAGQGTVRRSIQFGRQTAVATYTSARPASRRSGGQPSATCRFAPQS